MRWRLWAAVLLGCVAAAQFHLLRADQLLLVEDGSRQWLLARHGGRAALISRRADGLSCSRGAQLAQGLGVQQAVQSLGHVAEGVYSARTVLARARHLGVDMPLAETVVALLDGQLQPAAAVQRLMARDPREE